MSKPKEDKSQGSRKKLGKDVSRRIRPSRNSVSFIGDPTGPNNPRKKKLSPDDPNQESFARKQNDRFFSKDSKKVLAPNEIQQALLQEWLSSQHSGKKHEADVRAMIPCILCYMHAPFLHAPSLGLFLQLILCAIEFKHRASQRIVCYA